MKKICKSVLFISEAYFIKEGKSDFWKIIKLSDSKEVKIYLCHKRKNVLSLKSNNQLEEKKEEEYWQENNTEDVNLFDFSVFSSLINQNGTRGRNYRRFF